MLKRTFKAVQQYLEDNTPEALDLAEQMNAEDSSFDWVEVYDWDELCQNAADSGKEAVNDLVRAAVYGETYGGMVRYDGYGNLKSGEREDLLNDAADYLNDIVNVFSDYVDDEGYIDPIINVSNQLKEIIEESIYINVKAFNIQYDFDSGEIEETGRVEDAPSNLVLQIHSEFEEDDDDISEEVADAITEKTGWEVVDFDYEIIEEEE